jgi:hypothetical protein
MLDNMMNSSGKKNKQIQEKQEEEQKLRMNWYIPNQSGGSQDKSEKSRQ